MILYVLRYYPTLSETFVYREIAELRRRGISVTVAAIGARDDGHLQDELPDVEVLRPPRGLAALSLVRVLPLVARRLPLWRWLRRHLRPRDAARALWLGTEARRRGAARIHAHFAGEAAEWALGAAAIAGVPYGVTVHAVDLFRPRPSLPDILADAAPLVTVAEHHRRWLADHHGVPSHLARCGVDLDRYRPAPGPRTGPFRLVCVARYAPKKGVDRLVQIVRSLPDLTLRLVSDAPGLACDQVEIGPAPPSRIPALLADADAFVLAARIAADGDRDGIPVALIEAMAAGLPVITTAVSGIPELVDDTVGWLVAPDDDDAFCRALRTAANDRSACRRRGAAGRRRVIERDLTVRAQVDALVRAWEAG